MLRLMALVITLLAVGALLLLAETVLPGMIAGILGGLCLVAAVIVAFVDLGPSAGTYVFAGTSAGVIIGFAIWASVFPKTRAGRAFISERAIGGVTAGDATLLAQTGAAITALRPCGTAEINGRRVDVISEGAMVEKGTPLKVVAIEGMRVVVRAVAGPEPQPEHSSNNPPNP